MPITRAVIEAKLVRSARGLLDAIAASEDGAPTADQSPLAADALSDAMVRLGYTVSDHASGPADGELAVVPDKSLSTLFDLSSVLLDEAILGNLLALVTEQAADAKVEWSDMAKGLERKIARRWGDLAKRLGNTLNPRGAARTVSGVLAPRPVVPDAVSEPYE